MIYMYLSNNPSSGDINSTNLSCVVFCLPSELNIPDGPIYEKIITTISMDREKFYQLHAAQRQLLQTLCMLGNFSCVLCCLLASSFQIFFFLNSFRNTVRVSSNLDPDQERHSITSDLGPSFKKVISKPQMFLHAG